MVVAREKGWSSFPRHGPGPIGPRAGRLVDGHRINVLRVERPLWASLYPESQRPFHGVPLFFLALHLSPFPLRFHRRHGARWGFRRCTGRRTRREGRSAPPWPPSSFGLYFHVGPCLGPACGAPWPGEAAGGGLGGPRHHQDDHQLLTGEDGGCPGAAGASGSALCP